MMLEGNLVIGYKRWCFRGALPDNHLSVTVRRLESKRAITTFCSEVVGIFGFVCSRLKFKLRIVGEIFNEYLS